MRKWTLWIIFMLFLTGCQQDDVLPMIDVVEQQLHLPHEIDGTTIYLPSWFSDIPLIWESSNDTLISPDGHVMRVFEDHVVILTVTYPFQGESKEKTFHVTIKGRPLTSLEIVQLDLQAIELPGEISSDITLPKWGEHGSAIVWTSSASHIISRQGIYYPPIDGEDVTLTASVRYEDIELTKAFVVYAHPMPDHEKVLKDEIMLSIQLPSPLTNLVLPSRGYFSSDITWTSSHPEIISSSGVYHKPIGLIDVILTATLTKGEASMTKSFTIHVEGYDPETFMQTVEEKLAIQHGIDVIFDTVSLSHEILGLASISWSSSHPQIISEDGHFHRPEQTTTVTLIAHVTAGEYEHEIPYVYTLYGKHDLSTERIDQKMASVPLNLDDLYHIDQYDDLTQGTFDRIVYRNQRLMLAGTNLEGSYTSPVLTSEYAIKRINLMWGSITSPVAKTEFLTRYLSSSGWSEWTSHGVWGYGGENLPPSITRFFPSDVYHMQYQITLMRSTQEISSPEVTFVSIQPVTEHLKIYDRSTLNASVLYDVPQLKQADTVDAGLWSNICWATSISMMLQYYHKMTHLDVPQEYYSVTIRKGTERYGTTKNDIGATQFNVNLYELEFHSEDMLLHVIAHHGPLIVGVSKGISPDGKFGPLTYSSGHVIVVVGYEIHPNGDVDIIVNDPAVSWMRHTIKGSLAEFMLVWDRGGMLMQSRG